MANTAREHYRDGFLAAKGAAHTRAPAPAPTSAASTPAPGTTLSWEEQVKAALFPFDAFPRVLECARADQPPPDDDRFRFQWFGLFYHGPQTDAFSVRTRLPGGRLTAFQWRGLAEIVQELAAGAAELNPSGGLDIPGVPVRACAQILRRLERIGLSTRGTGGDCVQSVRGASPAPVDELEHIFAESREFGDLPGPCELVFRTAAEWQPLTRDGDDGDTILFQESPPPKPRPAASATAAATAWPAAQPPAEPSTWDLRLPGAGSLRTALAVSTLVPACLALLRVWSSQADRTNRTAASLKNFCTQLRAAGLRAALEQQLGSKLPTLAESGAAPRAATDPPPGAPVPKARLLSGQMSAIAAALAQCHLDELRWVQPGRLLIPAGVDAAAIEPALQRIIAPAQPS